jgi:hypothetical protein
MPLTRGNVIGYDADRMMFKFTMFTPDLKVIACQISSVALDCIDGKRGTIPSEREEQFIRHRDTIEKVTSDIFEDDNAMRVQVVRVFEKHLSSKRNAKARG